MLAIRDGVTDVLDGCILADNVISYSETDKKMTRVARTFSQFNDLLLLLGNYIPLLERCIRIQIVSNKVKSGFLFSPLFFFAMDWYVEQNRDIPLKYRQFCQQLQKDYSKLIQLINIVACVSLIKFKRNLYWLSASAVFGSHYLIKHKMLSPQVKNYYDKYSPLLNSASLALSNNRSMQVLGAAELVQKIETMRRP